MDSKLNTLRPVVNRGPICFFPVREKIIAIRWAATQPKVVKFFYTWNIENFADAWELTDTLRLTVFPAGPENPVQWQLVLTKDKTKESEKEFISLGLHQCKSDYSLDSANVKCSILNHEETLQKKRFEMSKCTKVIFKPFVYLDTLLDKSKKLLPNNVLTIFCEIRVLTDTVSTCGTIESIRVSESTMSTDFAKIFESETFCDVVIETAEGQEIPAHKCILSARSEFFKAMFNNDMAEKQQSRVTMHDFKPEVIKEMLRFIYTDTAPKLDKICKDLLAAANMYLLERLKNLCERFLVTKLTVDNAVSIFVLANMHNANQLQAQTFNFINDQADSVRQTDDWKDMLRDDPKFMIEHFNPKYFPAMSKSDKPNFKQFSCEKCG